MRYEVGDQGQAHSGSTEMLTWGERPELAGKAGGAASAAGASSLLYRTPLPRPAPVRPTLPSLSPGI